jgi:UDP-GlcNAc:undecaprenyl-phosphate GlcNAc-1-phosphate transferase
MEYSVLIAGFLVAFGTTALLTPVVRRLAIDYDWVDHPDGHRKLHADIVPAIGGLAIAIGFAVGLAYLHAVRTLLPFEVVFPPSALWAGALVIVASGFYDDTRGLGFKGKLAVQILVAYALLHAGYRVDLAWIPFVSEDPYSQALLSIPVTMLWIVGVINAVNLLDGLDGLAAGVSLIAFASLGLIFGLHGEIGLVMIALIITGALAGFLLFNFNPASIFMGDSGSLFLGYLLATYSLAGTGHTSPWVALVLPAVVLGLPLVDTALSIARRFVEQKAIFAADRDHIHHRLTRTLSHRDAVLVLYGVALTFGLAAVAMSLLPAAFGAGVILGICALTGLGLNRLKYLRRSYVVPDVHAIGETGAKNLSDTAQPMMSATFKGGELAGSTGEEGSQTEEAMPSSAVGVERGDAQQGRAKVGVVTANRAYDVPQVAS